MTHADHDLHCRSRYPRGPAAWLLAVLSGALAGAALGATIPGQVLASGKPDVPLWAVAPFVALLACIALFPFLAGHFWHARYPDIALGLGGLAGGYYAVAFRTGHAGLHALEHAALEYYSFAALIIGLFIVSGGIHIEVRGRGRPIVNTLLLAFGAVFANLVGTTGAAMLLVRPYMRINSWRLHPMHLVLFILIVCNCGGCLTPIGDPPLYLGYLSGVPFFWTLRYLGAEWLFTNGVLLLLAFMIDASLGRASAAETATSEPGSARAGVRVSGAAGIVCLALLVACVFVDPMLAKYAGLKGIPVGATLQIVIAIIAYRFAPRSIHDANQFNFAPAKEVGLLFAGIFIAMVPALAYLGQHGAKLGVDSPTAFYYATGSLSAFLDNAPTYLNFLQVAIGPDAITPESIRILTGTPAGQRTLEAISTGAVFFGALTYIGNGPNFMVKAIAEQAGVRMPSFFGYLLRAGAVLGPVLIAHWAIFLR